MENQNISIVIPLYKNYDSVVSLCSQIEKSVMQHSLKVELILIVDGCEKTWDCLANVNSKYISLRKFYSSKNRGQHRSIRFGLERVSYETIIVMDGDLQDSPENLGFLISEFNKGYDAAIALRQSTINNQGKPVLSKSFYWLIEKLFKKRIPRDISNYGVYSSSVVSAFLSNFKKNAPLPLVALLILENIAFVPLVYRKREQGKSSYNIFKRIKLALSIFNLFATARISNKHSTW